MAEALGVAGSLVSLVSASIQSAHGLLNYCKSWKDQNNAVKKMCISLDNLSESLTVLKKALQPPARFDESIKDRVEMNVKTMYDTMKNLDDELSKVRDVESSKNRVGATMERQFRRALYPFREDTLNKIQKGITEAHRNLNLALEVLQMSVCPGYYKGEANWNPQLHWLRNSSRCLGNLSRCSQACSLARR